MAVFTIRVEYTAVPWSVGFYTRVKFERGERYIGITVPRIDARRKTATNEIRLF